MRSHNIKNLLTSIIFGILVLTPFVARAGEEGIVRYGVSQQV